MVVNAPSANDEEVPRAVKALIDATNAADAEGFVNQFSADAHVQDGDAQFRGREGVAQWNRTDNVGVGMHFDLLSVSHTGGDEYDVALHATSRRFSGDGTMHITLRDGLISRLVIG